MTLCFLKTGLAGQVFTPGVVRRSPRKSRKVELMKMRTRRESVAMG